MNLQSHIEGIGTTVTAIEVAQGAGRQVSSINRDEQLKVLTLEFPTVRRFAS